MNNFDFSQETAVDHLLGSVGTPGKPKGSLLQQSMEFSGNSTTSSKRGGAKGGSFGPFNGQIPIAQVHEMLNMDERLQQQLLYLQ